MRFQLARNCSRLHKRDGVRKMGMMRKQLFRPEVLCRPGRWFGSDGTPCSGHADAVFERRLGAGDCCDGRAVNVWQLRAAGRATWRDTSCDGPHSSQCTGCGFRAADGRHERADRHQRHTALRHQPRNFNDQWGYAAKNPRRSKRSTADAADADRPQDATRSRAAAGVPASNSTISRSRFSRPAIRWR